MNETRTVAIIGSGAWGTALAVQMAGRGHRVRLWSRRSDHSAALAKTRENREYLPGIPLPEAIEPVDRFPAALDGVDVVVAAVPTPFARDVYRGMAGCLAPEVPLAVTAKGIEEHSLDLPLAVARGELGLERKLLVLSGPSFADELARGLATAVVIAAQDETLARRVQAVLATPTLRLYTNADPVGVQLAGALKNVMAIAAGVADSLGLGGNTRAALITRGLSEMTRLGLSLGGRASTFSGLAGLGDLILTCTGDLSRNRRVGRLLGRGDSLDSILAGTRQVAEGIKTARSARMLAARQGVPMPIVSEVYRILYEGGAPRDALDRLMSRPLTSEEISNGGAGR